MKGRRTSVRRAYAAYGIAHQRVGRIRTKLAKYEHRFQVGSMTNHISAHESTQSHKLARDTLCRPETHLALAPLSQPKPRAAASGAVPSAAAAAASVEAASDAVPSRGLGKELAAASDLFKGRAPQVQERLDAWADI